jgi:hypothetical protein
MISDVIEIRNTGINPPIPTRGGGVCFWIRTLRIFSLSASANCGVFYRGGNGVVISENSKSWNYELQFIFESVQTIKRMIAKRRSFRNTACAEDGLTLSGIVTQPLERSRTDRDSMS